MKPPRPAHPGRLRAWLNDGRNLPYVIFAGLLLVSLLSRLVLVLR